MIEGVRERETDLPVSPMSGGERERVREKSDYRSKTQLAREAASGNFILGEAEITKTPSFLNSIF